MPSHGIFSPFFLHKKRAEIKDFFLKQGFVKASVSLELLPIKTSKGKHTLKIVVNKGGKSRIATIGFQGNDHFDASHLIYSMKEIKPAPHFTLVKDMVKQILTLKPIRKSGLLLQLPTVADVMRYVKRHVSFSPSIFTEASYAKAKENLVSFYQSNGFLDMRIVEERMQYADDDTGKLHLQFNIEEGQPYTIRHINWMGNYLYDDQTLNRLLNLPAGRIYDPLYINKRLSPATTPTDVTIADLYTNNGYVFFRAEVIETGIADHQVDLEIRLVEGKQATIAQVAIVGNTLTHEEVIRRELTTLPGQKYNRLRILESLQNLAMLDFFKPQKLIPAIDPNEAEGTINLTYHVEEQPKFDCKLNGTYSRGIVFELSLGSKNVSLRNLFRGKLPLGAAQHLHLTASVRGQNYKNLSLTFQEPWLWIRGKRYICSLHVNSSYQVFKSTHWMSLDRALNVVLFPFAALSHKKSTIYTTGGRMTLGKKLNKYWESHFGVDYHYHHYRHHQLLDDRQNRSGKLHDFSLEVTLLRNSVNDINFPTAGWSWSNLLTFTPPYTLMGYQPAKVSTIPSVKEFGKFMTDFSFFQQLPADFVLHARAHAGLLWSLSKKAITPFQRFYMGGTSSDIATYGMLGVDFIPLRGYPNDSLTPKNYANRVYGGVLYHKFVAELRYPIMLSPACFYLLGFLEMGDNWLQYNHYDPLAMKRSIGGGVRLILPLPIIPMIGLDVGYRLDPIKDTKEAKNKFDYSFTFGPSLR